ncbi:AsnC family protein, partial [Mesorhizobium sp. M2D.F.Ca.ET.145.01.1.1]
MEREDLFVELTEKDRQLLALMQKNAREPVASLARQLGVSRTALQEGIQELR